MKTIEIKEIFELANGKIIAKIYTTNDKSEADKFAEFMSAQSIVSSNDSHDILVLSTGTYYPQ